MTDFIEGGVITAVITLNVVIGFYQEFQAGKKMDSLRSLSSTSATFIRLQRWLQRLLRRGLPRSCRSICGAELADPDSGVRGQELTTEHVCP